MPHTHSYTHRRTYTTLTLPETSGRFELLTIHHCACGACRAGTSWSRNQGRHLSYAELLEVRNLEHVKPQRRPR